MIRDIFRSAFGGSNVITRWTLIVTFPLGLLAGTLWGIRMGVTVLPWMLVVGSVQTFLILPVWLLRLALDRINVRTPHPWLGVGALGFIGALRVALIFSFAPLFGVPMTFLFILGYLPYGVATGIVFMGIIAVIVDRSREHRVTMQNLAKIDRELARARDLNEAEFEKIEEQIAQDAQQSLTRDLAKLSAEPHLTSSETANALREMAAEVVRPMSHRLAEDSWTTEVDEEDVAVPLRERWNAVLGDIRPAPPLVPFILIELIALTDAAGSRYGGWVFSSLNMLMGGGVMFLLSLLLLRAWPPGRTTIFRFLFLLVTYAGIGAFAAWLMSESNWVFAGVNQTLWIASAMLLITSMGVAFLIAIENQRRNLQDNLAQSVLRNSQMTTQLRERARFARRRIAKFLHSNVQSELIAAAISLTREANESTDSQGSQLRTSDVLARLHHVLSQRLGPESSPQHSSRERVDDLLSLWSSVLTVNTNIPDEVWVLLDADSQARSLVDDVIAEGLTNAVRHGNGPIIDVALQRGEGELHIAMTSPGVITRGGAPGLGSRFLSESTREWTLTESDGQVHFFAIVPLTVAHS